MPIKHKFVSLIPDDPAAEAAGQVLPSDWNDEHDVQVSIDEIFATGTPDDTTFLRGDGSWSSILYPATSWGSITGTISEQTDLQEALSARMTKSSYDPANINEQLVGLTASQTLTNKRINPRISSASSSATPTPNADTTDEFILTAQSEAAAFAAPTGTPVQGQAMILRIKDDGTARALTWDAIYRAVGVSLPTTTVIDKLLYIAMIYNSTATRWDVLAVRQEQ